MRPLDQAIDASHSASASQAPSSEGASHLGEILGAVSLADFFDRLWPARLFVAGGDVQRFSALRPLLTSDPHAIVASCPGQVRTIYPVRDGHYDHTGYVWPDIAVEHLRNGVCSVGLDSIEAWRPEIGGMVRGIERELGLPEGRATCYATVSPRGRGLPAHFDSKEVIILQLFGEKRWRLAANDHVEFPFANYVAGQPADPRLSEIAGRPLPTAMPTPNREIVLRPGDALFLPRGQWHETEGEGDSFSLSFIFPTPTWADQLLAGLKSKVTGNGVWRMPANAGQNGRAAAEVAEIAAAIHGFVESFDQILDASSAAEMVRDRYNRS